RASSSLRSTAGAVSQPPALRARTGGPQPRADRNGPRRDAESRAAGDERGAAAARAARLCPDPPRRAGRRRDPVDSRRRGRAGVAHRHARAGGLVARPRPARGVRRRVVGSGATIVSAPMETIVVGVDGSEGGTAALEFAAGEAVFRGARLRIVSAWQVPVAAYGGDFVAPPPDPVSWDAFRVPAQRVA